MIQYKNCKRFISMTKDDVIKCKDVCEAMYHKKCVQNHKQFMSTFMINARKTYSALHRRRLVSRSKKRPYQYCRVLRRNVLKFDRY